LELEFTVEFKVGQLLQQFKASLLPSCRRDIAPSLIHQQLWHQR
jgi:hypothetical protein